jgi:hypothetical protein
MPKQVNLFQDLRDKITKQNGTLPAEKRAMFWMTNYATSLSAWQGLNKGTTFAQLAHDEKFTKELVKRPEPGFFYFYRYDPKWKDELPYYDLFPFTLVIADYPDRFLGLNFHYLSYHYRAVFFDALYPLREGRPSRPNVRDIRMRLEVTYSILQAAKSYRYFKPCLKMYLKTHVRSPLLKVGAKEWDVAIFLPVEQFKKKNKTYVWSQSRNQFF